MEATTPKDRDGSTARAEGASVDPFPAYVPAKRSPEELTLTAHPVAVAPVIDGGTGDVFDRLLFTIPGSAGK